MKSLNISSLTFAFPGDNSPILKELDMKLDPGTITAVIGNNGTGKTTLMRAILGILEIQDGDIFWEETVNNTRTPLKTSNIAFLPQNEYINPDLLVDEVILMGRLPFVGAFAEPNMEDLKKTEEAIHRLSLKRFATKKIGTLSGGERQRVRLARSIAQEAELILLDEPLTHLDVISKNQIINLILSLRSEGKTIIFSTHNPLEALKIADYAVLISNDHASEFGAVERILTSEKVSQCLKVKIRFGLDNGQYYQVVEDF